MFTVHDRLIQEFNCQVSNAKFSQKAFSKAHIKNIHNPNNENISCDLCEKTFRDEKIMKQHRTRTHIMIKIFVCNICDTTVSSQSHLQRHIQSLHEDQEQARNYKCNFCDNTFIDSSTYKHHLKYVHDKSKGLGWLNVPKVKKLLFSTDFPIPHEKISN